MIQRSNRSKRLGAALAAIAVSVVLGGLSISPALASTGSDDTSPSPTTPIDISQTERGASLIAEAEGRFSEAAEELSQGVAEQRTSTRTAIAYSAYTNVPGDDPDTVWVVPTGASLPEVSVADGRLRVTTADEAPSLQLPQTQRLSVSQQAATPQPWMHWYTAECLSRYNEQSGWMDRCRQWGALMDDGDSVGWHWAFKTWATCKSNTDWLISECSVEVQDNGTGGGLAWEDWAPKSDSNSNCRSVDMTVNLQSIGLGASFSTCDQVDITKFPEGGHFKSAWKGPLTYMSEREIGMQLALGTQYTIPQLSATVDIVGFFYVP